MALPDPISWTNVLWVGTIESGAGIILDLHERRVDNTGRTELVGLVRVSGYSVEVAGHITSDDAAILFGTWVRGPFEVWLWRDLDPTRTTGLLDREPFELRAVPR